MAACSYEVVNNNDTHRKFRWKPFLRQIMICSGVWVTYFMDGLITGAPPVMIPQIKRESNSTFVVTDDMTSWLSSILGLGGVPWVFVLPVLTQFTGRKIPFMVVCLTSFIGFSIFCFGNTVIHILVSEITLGVLLTSVCTVSPIIVTEYTSPQYRGIFLALKSACFFWGIWVANLIGTFMYWKNIGVLALICSVYTLLVFLWPESPYWLATKGRFEECADSHRWLKGTDADSEMELEKLIASQKEHLSKCNVKLSKGAYFKNCISNFFKNLACPEYYKPLFLSISLFSLYHFSGKLVYSMYVIQIIKKITDSEDTAYRAMLILDGVTVFGMYVGCGLSKYLRRRTQLLLFSLVGIVFLFITSLYLYLITLSVITESSYISISLLVVFSVAISCGPIIMCTSVYGELLPLRFRSSSMLIIALYTDVLYTILIKVAPSLFRLSFHGAFLFYALSATVFMIILYKYLPETKDKTLQEIEDDFKPVLIVQKVSEESTFSTL